MSHAVCRRRRLAATEGPQGDTANAGYYVSSAWRGTQDPIAFHPTSLLWQIIEHLPRRCPGIFFEFTHGVKLADIVAPYTRARVGLQARIKESLRPSGGLLDDVPNSPELGMGELIRGNATQEMKRLISKYNMQYRRPEPKHEMLPNVDRWYTMRLSDLPHGALGILHGQNFSVGWQELWETSVWGRRDVVDMGLPSSMILSLWSWSAVGGTWVTDEWAMVRRVPAISFPQLCLELMGQFTARAIEAAWESFPIVSDRKSSGGPPRRGKPSRWSRTGHRRH